MGSAVRANDPAVALLAQMTLAEKIGQLNLLPAGQGLATGAGGRGPLDERLDAGEVGAIFGTKSLASARAMQERALEGSRLRHPAVLRRGRHPRAPHGVPAAGGAGVQLGHGADRGDRRLCRRRGQRRGAAPGLRADDRRRRATRAGAASPRARARIRGSPRRIAVAMTRGLQGEGIRAAGRVAACLKHFVAYGATASGRDYDNASLAWEDLLDVYLPPFRAGVEAGAASVMVAFNAVNKVPMHAHGGLVEGWLRGGGRLRRAGRVGLHRRQGARRPTASATRRRWWRGRCMAGVDMDMVGEDYLRELPRLAEARDRRAGVRPCVLPPERIRALIDRACRRVLTFKARLGLLDDPFRGLDGATPAAAERRAARLPGAPRRESAVLLKNDGVLPLAARGRIALIGPFAEDRGQHDRHLGGVGRTTATSATLAEAFGRPRRGRARRSRLGRQHRRRAWLARRLNVHGADRRAGPPRAARRADRRGGARPRATPTSPSWRSARPRSTRASRPRVLVPGDPRAAAAAGRGAGRDGHAARRRGLRRPAAGARRASPSAAAALVYAWHGGIARAGGRGRPDLRRRRARRAAGGHLPVIAGRGAAALRAPRPTGRPVPRPVREVPHRLARPRGRRRRGVPLRLRPRLRRRSATAAPPVGAAARPRRRRGSTLTVEVTNGARARWPRRCSSTSPTRWRGSPGPARMLRDFRPRDAGAGRDAGASRSTVTQAMLRYAVAPSLAGRRDGLGPGRVRPARRPEQPRHRRTRLAHMGRLTRGARRRRAAATGSRRRRASYFTDWSHPASGMARERSAGAFGYDVEDTVTTGGTGFGMMAQIVAAERGWRRAAARSSTGWSGWWASSRAADRFDGVFPHFLSGATGPRASRSCAATTAATWSRPAFLMIGLLAAAEYFTEAPELGARIEALFDAVNWTAHLREDGGADVAPPPRPPVARARAADPRLERGDAGLRPRRRRAAAPRPARGLPRQLGDGAGLPQRARVLRARVLPLGPGLGRAAVPVAVSRSSASTRAACATPTPTTASRRARMRWSTARTAWPTRMAGAATAPTCWGLTASDDPTGYVAHSPTVDTGVITPTAALGSFPFAPARGDAGGPRTSTTSSASRIWGEAGFVDAFSPHHGWVAESRLAIDQGPIVVALENHRSGLIWRLVMARPEVRRGAGGARLLLALPRHRLSALARGGGGDEGGGAPGQARHETGAPVSRSNCSGSASPSGATSAISAIHASALAKAAAIAGQRRDPVVELGEAERHREPGVAAEEARPPRSGPSPARRGPRLIG